MKTKDAGLRIRVERELRDEFLEVCRHRDRPAAQVIREFMREYVAEHQQAPSASERPSRRARPAIARGRGTT